MARSGGLGWLVKDYVESRNGRIRWFPHLYLFIDAAGRKVRKLRWDKKPWEDRTDAATGRAYSLFRGRGAQCFHPDKWMGLFPYWSTEGRRAYFIVPQKECKACEFHEPAKRFGRRRYACCRWYRENSLMESPAELLLKAAKQASDIIRGC